jgi:hypothetical protein
LVGQTAFAYNADLARHDLDYLRSPPAGKPTVK